MKKMIIIICLLCCSCCSQQERIKRAEIRRETEKREKIHNKAIDRAIIKYLLDPTWTYKELEKEIRYQEYLQRVQ